VCLPKGGEQVIRIQQKTITVSPDSELSLTLEAAQTTGEPVIVDTGERTYTLFVTLTEPTRDDFAHYDPQAAIAGLRALDEALAGVDREQFLRDVYAQRAQDSQGRPA
jgi:hypothetical protein